MIKIANQNADPQRMADAERKKAFEESVRNQFNQLRYRHAELQVQDRKIEQAKRLGMVYSVSGFSATPNLSPEAIRQRQIQLQIAKAEAELRKLMGVADDGRLIVPKEDQKQD